MKDNYNQSEKEIIKFLEGNKEEFLLTQTEKFNIKAQIYKKIDKLDISVTKPDIKRYSIWLYKLNIKGVIMPIIPMILAILLAGGVGTTALANNAIPGDALFGLDQVMERIEERMSMSQSRRARFLGKLSEERAQELLALREMNQERFTERAQERWTEHHEGAVERLAISIEKVEVVQVKFQEKVVSAETNEQKVVFQKVVDHLGEVATRREARLTEIENKEFPGVKAFPIRQKIQEWKQISPEIREEVHTQILKEFNGELPNMGVGKGRDKGINFDSSE